MSEAPYKLSNGLLKINHNEIYLSQDLSIFKRGPYSNV